MAEPLRIEDYISPLPTQSDWEDTGSQAGHARSAKARLEELSRMVAQVDQKVKDTIAGARRLVEESQANPPTNLDEVIRRLEEMEAVSSAGMAPALRSLAGPKRTFAQDPEPRFRLKSLTLLGQLEKAIAHGLEALRDARWELMALRSELNRDHEQRIEFDGSRSLQELLGTLKSST